MCCFYHTSNTINLVTATKYTAFWVIEYCVFVKDLIDCSATTHGVIFAKYVAQITKQQGRYAVGHRVLRFTSRVPSPLAAYRMPACHGRRTDCLPVRPLGSTYARCDHRRRGNPHPIRAL